METAFLSVQNVLEEFSSANADTLTSLIKDELVQQCGSSLKNLIGLATDGAAVMIGKNNGVGAQLNPLNPAAFCEKGVSWTFWCFLGWISAKLASIWSKMHLHHDSLAFLPLASRFATF